MFPANSSAPTRNEGRRRSFRGPLPMSELFPKVRERLQSHDGVRFSALLLLSTEANPHFGCSVGICDILELRKAANSDVAGPVCCLGPSARQIQSLRCSAVPAAKDKALFSCFFWPAIPLAWDCQGWRQECRCVVIEFGLGCLRWSCCYAALS